MKTIFRPFLLAYVLFLAIPGCSLFQSKDDVLYDKALERKKFLEPLQGNYKLISYEKNGLSILDSFPIYKATELTYNFSIRWSTDKYETYSGFIRTNIFIDSVNKYNALGSWDEFNMDNHKIVFYIDQNTTDTITKQNISQTFCKFDSWTLITLSNELNFKLINADTTYLIKFKRS